MRIRISGEAKVVDDEDNPIVRPSILKKLAEVAKDGETFSDYFGNDSKLNGLVTGGYLEFEYDDAKNKLIAVTEYDAHDNLTGDLMKELLDYTVGQWSDGIGEGFEQWPQLDYYYISAWDRNKTRTLEIKNED